jgi:hypothetical protein
VWFDLYVCGATWGRGRLGGLRGRARGWFCGAACGKTTVFEKTRGCDCWTALPARSTTLPAPRPRVPEATCVNRSPHGERGRVGRGQRLWGGGHLRGPWFSRRPASAATSRAPRNPCPKPPRHAPAAAVPQAQGAPFVRSLLAGSGAGVVIDGSWVLSQHAAVQL